MIEFCVPHMLDLNTHTHRYALEKMGIDEYVS